MDLYMRPQKRARVETSTTRVPVTLSKRAATVHDLPNEILCHIFSLVPGHVLNSRVNRVCKQWRTVCEEIRMTIIISAQYDRPDVIFDLAGLAYRFMRLRALTISNKNFVPHAIVDVDDNESGEEENLDDSDNDDEEEVPVPAVPVPKFDLLAYKPPGTAKKYPLLQHGKHHPVQWYTALDPRVVRWSTTLGRIELESVRFEAPPIWLSTLCALQQASFTDINTLSFKDVVTSLLMGSAPTLTYLAMAHVYRATPAESVETFDTLLRHYPKLAVLVLSHIEFAEEKKCELNAFLSRAPFPEHGALRALQLQNIRIPFFPLNRFRLPGLQRLTLKSITLPEERFAVNIAPSLDVLDMSKDVKNIASSSLLHRWMPSVACIRVAIYDHYPPEMLDWIVQRGLGVLPKLRRMECIYARSYADAYHDELQQLARGIGIISRVCPRIASLWLMPFSYTSYWMLQKECEGKLLRATNIFEVI